VTRGSASAPGTGGAARGFPVQDPVATLAPTAQKILAAAKRLLVEKGYVALTLENVAAAAGVNKASIRYHFGDKAGLVAAVVDSMIHDAFIGSSELMPSLPPGDRARALLERKRSLIEETDDFRGLFDLMPHAFRDPALARRIYAGYPWWYEQNLQLLGLGDRPEAERPQALAGLGQLITAVVDGLALQAALDPRGCDLGRPLAALELLLAAAMPQLEEMARPGTEDRS
jgi:AcrR family transcriptional regulator